MGENMRRRAAEVAALKLGLDLGMTLVDTAEMYGSGRAETIVADAIEDRRDGVFLVSKVLPQNASRKGTIQACERSLARLRTDRIDLYLLHWPGSHPLDETLDAFASLREQGKILHYGLSNFDTDELEEAARLPDGKHIAADQVLYNLGRRGIERRLLPWCHERGVVVMAYSPLEQGRLDRARALKAVAERHGVSQACVAIAWTIREDGVVSIPKATSPDHVRENARAASLALTQEDLAELDAAFPAPARDVPLETL
jgi:diketogulonate reductase-like aldo/keto reductase